jgi:hypothetical protein
MPPAAVDGGGGGDAGCFSVELIEMSKRHVEFLGAMHASGISLKRPSASSFRRYELWLTLVARVPHDKALVPPSDVAWLWHCHRLAPYRYAQHCREAFRSSPLEANPPFSMQHTEWSRPPSCGKGGADADAGAETRRLWEKYFPSEPFFPAATSTQEPPAPAGVGILAGYDVLASAERQATFLWQVSGPKFVDEGFLAEGRANYARFIRLMKIRGPGQTLVPTYQIDLMWHTHILTKFAAYNKDCIELMGTTLNHDDSLNDRSEGSDLEKAFNVTKGLWKDTFGADYVVDGGMYRGEPPPQYVFASKLPQSALRID